MRYRKAKINVAHAFVSSLRKASGALTDSSALPLTRVKLRLNLKKKVICTMMNISELREGWTYELISCITGTAIQLFSRHYLGGRKVNASPTTQVNTLYILEFPTKLLTIAILCLPLLCVYRKWEKVWVARKWDCSVVEALRDNIANI